MTHQMSNQGQTSTISGQGMTHASFVDGSPDLRPQERKRWAGLDGLRGIAILSVFCFHYFGVFCGIRVFWWGWVGVDLFFVLSGFLITRGLLATLSQRRYFFDFYLKRSLRIFPLYYGFWLLLLLLTWVLHVEWEGYIVRWILYIGNLNSWSQMRNGSFPTWRELHLGVAAGHHLVLEFGHFWSLCVEEQFYAVWPVLLFLLRRRDKIRLFCWIGLGAEPIIRLLMYIVLPGVHYRDFIYYQTYTRLDGLLLGSLISVALFSTVELTFQPKRLGRSMMAGAASVWIVLYSISAVAQRYHGIPLHEVTVYTPWIEIPGFSVIAVFFGGLLMETLQDDSPLQRLLKNRHLRRLGAISYGMYFFHMLPQEYLIEHAGRIGHWKILASFVAFAMTIGLSEMSYRFYETPFLKLKMRLTWHHG